MGAPRISRLAAIFIALMLVGCGDTCFSGLTNTGTGVVIVKAPNPAGCPLTKANGIVRMVAARTPRCTVCTPAARIEHHFVTLQSIELGLSEPDGTHPAEWIAIPVTSEVHRIDLIRDSDSASEVLAEDAAVPSGSYRAVRLTFLAQSSSSTNEASDAVCGNTANCIVRGDGHGEPLLLAGNTLEVELGSPVFVLPDARTELQLDLEPRLVFMSSATGLEARYTLGAQITVK